MAERLADIVAKITNVRQLEAVVTAMRGIAASRAQQARSLLAGIEAYSDVVAQAMGEALALLPEGEAMRPVVSRQSRGLILFCAEQGFAGAFSDRVLDAAAQDLEGADVFVLGTRGAAIAGERGIGLAWSAPMATQTGAVTTIANRVADALYAAVADGRMTDVDILFPFFAPASGMQITRRSLLPLDLARFKQPIANLPPLTTLAPRALVESLAAEYVFAQLCDAAMHAFAAENEARMMAMAAAKTNIQTKLSELSRRERQLRQEEITTEIIELAAGAEALANRR
ncbi:MAG: F0F1 ATP synthase subunit gamma [Methylovirgula sp.]